MHPTLFELPFRIFGREAAVHTYGLFVGLGFLAGVYFAVRQARRAGLNPVNVLDLCFWLIVAGVLGGRLMFMVVNVGDYLSEPYGLLKVWQGGFVWYGGFLGALGAGWVFLRMKPMPFLKTADAVIPGVAIGHAIGRLGCFAAGCCWGRGCGRDFPFGVVFTDPEALAPKGVPLHPVQLYEAAGETVIFLLLLAAAGRKKYDGRVLLLYMTLYPVLRAVLEAFRGDIQRGFLIDGILSTSQLISLLIFAAAVMAQVAIYFRRRAIK